MDESLIWGMLHDAQKREAVAKVLFEAATTRDEMIAALIKLQHERGQVDCLTELAAIAYVRDDGEAEES